MTKEPESAHWWQNQAFADYKAARKTLGKTSDSLAVASAAQKGRDALEKYLKSAFVLYDVKEIDLTKKQKLTALAKELKRRFPKFDSAKKLLLVGTNPQKKKITIERGLRKFDGLPYNRAQSEDLALVLDTLVHEFRRSPFFR